MAEYVRKRHPLGGLLFLLPPIFRFDNKEGSGDSSQPDGSEPLKDLLHNVEQSLIHTDLPVSMDKWIIPFGILFL